MIELSDDDLLAQVQSEAATRQQAAAPQPVELDDEALVSQALDEGKFRSEPIDLKQYGFRHLTAQDWQEVDTEVRTPRTALGAAADTGLKDAPFANYAYSLRDLYGLQRAFAGMQIGEATPEQERDFAMFLARSKQDTTFGGGVVDIAKSMVTMGGEFAATGGGSAVARGGLKLGLRTLRGEALDWFEAQGAKVATNAVVKRIPAGLKAGAARAAEVTAAQEAIPRIFGEGGGAWTLASTQRMFKDWDMTDDEARTMATLLNEDMPEFLDAKVSLWKGMQESFISNAFEQSGGALARLPGFSYLAAIQTKALGKVAGEASEGSFKDALAKVAKGFAYDGPLQETLEELAGGMAVEGWSGESPVDGLPEDFEELAQIFVASSIPGFSGAGIRGAMKRSRDAERAKLASRQEAAAGLSPAGATPSLEGGDEASTPGGATAATAEAEPGVLSTEELAEVRAADVESFREEATEAVGRDVELEEAEPATQEEFAAQAFLRRRGIEPIFVRADDANGLPQGFFPGEGRAVVLADNPGVQGAAIEEAVHTWEAQQTPERRAALDAELRGIDSQFVTRVESWWRDNSLVPEPDQDLVAEETRATAARFLGPLVAYLETDQGASDFAQVYTESPGALARTWEAIRDWVAERVSFLKPSKRAQAEARLESLRGTLPETAPELAQSILGALREIRPVQLQAPTREQVDAFEAAAPPVEVKRPKEQRQRQKKERGGKRKAEAAEKAAEKAAAKEEVEAAEQKAGATPTEKPRGDKRTPSPNASEKRKKAAKQKDALGRSFTPTTYAATVDTEGLIGKGLTPRFASPITADAQAALERAGLAAPFKLTASFLEDGQLVTKWDKFQRVFSDEFIALKKYVDGAKKLGADLAANPTSAVRRYFGKISERASEIEQNFTEPILALLKEKGIKLDDAGDYAYARHVEEANEKFLKDHLERAALASQRTAIKRSIKDLPRDSQIEKDLRALDKRIADLDYVPIRLPKGVTAQEFFHEIDPRSGMKTSEAQVLVAKSEAQVGYKDLGQMIDRMNRTTRDRMLADGLLTPEEYAAWTSQYQHYVPLRTAEVDKPEGPRSSGLTVRGKESKRRKGRKSKADNPLVMSFVQALNAAQRGEKNAVGLELREFLKANRELLGNGEREAQMDAKGRPIVSEYEFHLKVDGRDVALTLENKDVADALKRVGIPSIPSAMKYYAAGMRVWRAMVTSANPEFVLNNLVRDIQTALINVQSVSEEFDVNGLRGQMMRDLKGAGKTAYQHARGKPVTTGMGERYDEYRQNGGQIGTFSSPDFQEQSKRIEAELRRAEQQGPVREAAKKAGDVARVGWQFVEDVNQAVETATRFSFYNALRDRGVTAKDAAFAARQLTVDFSQKGTWGTGISLVYAFFSAGVGGTRRLLEEMARSKTSQKIAGGIAAQAFVMSFVNEMMSADDEDGLSFYSKIPDYEKEQYMLFMLPGAKEPIKILSPWGYNVFMNIGRLAAETTAGKRTASSAAASMFAVTSSNFNPMGSAPSFGQFLAPTLLDPVVQIQENQNFAGTPIAPGQSPFGAERAAFARSGRDTYDINIKIAEVLNSLTGGDEIRPGAINLAGDHVEHVMSFLGGGVGRFVVRSLKAADSAVQGEFDAEATPFIRSVYGARTEFVDREHFYDARDEIAYQKAAIKLAKDDKDHARARELQARFRYTLRVDKKLNAAGKKAAELKDAAYAKSKFDPDETLLDQADAVLKAAYGEYVLAVQKNGQSSK